MELKMKTKIMWLTISMKESFCDARRSQLIYRISYAKDAFALKINR